MGQTYIVKILKKLDNWGDIILKLFYIEIAFILLPIVVIIFIELITTGNLHSLYLSPLWSFASIVLYGNSMTKLIELKAEIQKDFSNRIYVLMKHYLLLTIFTVIILCMVMLRNGKINILNEQILFKIQMILFILSIIFLIMPEVVKNKYIIDNIDKSSSISMKRYYKIMCFNLIKSYNNLISVKKALNKKPDFKCDKEDEDESKCEAKFILDRIEATFIKIKPILAASANNSSSIETGSN